MRFSSTALTATVAACSSAIFLGQTTQAFNPSLAFVRSPSVIAKQSNVGASASSHGVFCPCPSCVGVHAFGCNCAPCARGRTMLFADATEVAASSEDIPSDATEVAAASEDIPSDVTEATAASEDVPSEVVAMDGIADDDEAHNAERPARKELRKKRPSKGKPLSEFTVGSTVKATVKSVASYGAFCDLGATSDGLLHISRMSKDYVGDVNEVLSIGQEVDVRIVDIDPQKNQIALSLLTEVEENEAKAAQVKSRETKRERKPQGTQQSSGARTANPVLAELAAKGFDAEKFVTGKVVSTVAFGAFVKVEANQLNEAVEGEFEGLVHISALTAGRANSVTDVVNVDDTVNVRVKSIGDGKVSLTMVSVEDEESQAASRNQAQVEKTGAADWKDSLEKMKHDMPVFTNKPLIVDMRK